MVKKTRSSLLAIVLLTIPLQSIQANGHFEFGFHYGKWSIGVFSSKVEETLNETLEKVLKDIFLEDILEDFPFLHETGLTQDLDYDSEGSNYGFELRWYPGGQKGSFSLGFSLEKTTMNFSLPVFSSSLNFEELVTFKANATGDIRMDPLSLLMSLRWDIKPSLIVHPYITIGFGAATKTTLERGKVLFTYDGTLSLLGITLAQYEGQEVMTLTELKEELEEEDIDFPLPGFIPFIQLNLGLKGRISKNLFILVDAGIWDGFLIRGGIAIRL